MSMFVCGTGNIMGFGLVSLHMKVSSQLRCLFWELACPEGQFP